MPWLMRNAKHAETEDPLGDITVRSCPLSLKNGWVSSEAQAISLSAPTWTPGNTIQVRLERDEAARLKWVARATANPKKVDWRRAAMHFVRVTGANHGDRIVGTDGLRLHFAAAPVGLMEPTCVNIPLLGDIKAGWVDLPVYDGDDYPAWEVIVPRNFPEGITVEAGPLQDLAKHGDKIAFIIDGRRHVFGAAFLADALHGLGKQQRIQVCFQRPGTPIGIKMPSRGAVLLPAHEGYHAPPGYYLGPPQDSRKEPFGASAVVFGCYAIAWDSLTPDPPAIAIDYQRTLGFEPRHLYWL